MWVFFIAVPVLLYSLGRGDFTATVKAYLVAAKRGDSVAANRLLDEMRGDTLPVTEPDANNWQELNHQVLTAISYRGRSEEHTSELQSRGQLVCRLLLEKKNTAKSVASDSIKCSK